MGKTPGEVRHHPNTTHNTLVTPYIFSQQRRTCTHCIGKKFGLNFKNHSILYIYIVASVLCKRRPQKVLCSLLRDVKESPELLVLIDQIHHIHYVIVVFGETAVKHIAN